MRGMAVSCFGFAALEVKKLSADRDGEPAFSILCFRGVCDEFFRKIEMGSKTFFAFSF